MFTRILLLTFSIFIVAVGALAQKKDIASAKDMVKNNRDLEKAEMMMRTLLKDSANRENAKIWNVLFDAVKKQYDNGNEQLYLKNKYDTAQLFINARKMFEVYEAFDSVDAAPDSKGIVRPKMRKKHSEFLLPYRKNLFTGGLFFVHKQNFSEAYRMFDVFISSASHPLFSGYKGFKDDRNMGKAAYLALFCGYKLNDVTKTMRYLDMAMSDTANMNNKCQYLAEIYITANDSAKYVETLEKGFSLYPRSMYYFPRLFDYYFDRHNDLSKSLSLCDEALKADSTNMVFLLAKSSVLLRQDCYDECIKICDSLIARNDSLADAFLNAGLAFYNQAVKLGSNIVEARKHRASQKALYRQSLPYMQRYRELAPEAKSKWGVPLYTIFLNLNKGKEFEEMDRLLKETKQSDTK